ncbi:PEGA domain-containing protein [Deinococcus sp. RIT780]|uniref:PEGA domain-containing protein n=1 Tax=Deinococcus sp. RIT780 TaxID=2870472 RepID=UPI001C89FC81|nr:PEGA domain-containing protein [Deinococcus sp. RIT780]
MRLAPDEETVALYNGQGAALFDLATGLRLNDFPVGGDVFDAAFSPDGSLLALATKSTTLTVWDRETATVSTTVKPDDRAVSAIAFSPDGRTLAVGTESGPLFLFDSKTGERLAELRGHSNGVRQLTFTSDGRYLLSLGYDSTVRVWGNPKASAFAAPASLTLASSTPGATAILDGTPLGNLDATGLTLTVAAEAPHLLKVVAPGRLPYAATLTLKAGEERVLTIDPSPLTGKATIQSTPAGANVIIDGKVAGKTPLTVENLPDGALDFRLKFAGYAEYAGQVTVQGGGAATATAALKELPGLNVKSNPVGATVLVDGQALGVTPLAASGLKPGKYVVTVRLKGFKDQTATVTIPESGKVNLDITLKK